jgi:serine/threonine protein kinase
LYVTESIGAGGIGEAYRATDIKLGRDVALKILLLVISNVPRYNSEAVAKGIPLQPPQRGARHPLFSSWELVNRL